jgi:uncharacterized protein (TIGR03083 family)
VSKPSGEEIARHYEAAHRRITDLVRDLDRDDLATPVSATPGWTVHDVLAHLAALPTDILAGRVQGIPGPEVTGRQVAERADRSAQELLDEWDPNVESMCEGARAGLIPSNLSVDVLTHEQDVRGALGLAPALSAEELRFTTAVYGFGLGRVLSRDGLPALAVESSDTDYATVAGDGPPAATVRAPEFELFRLLAGRRSRRQALDYTWSGDPEPYADRLNLFGAMPEADVLGE